ncbi:helix-turn-helix transcriptional regulator [Microbacterium sp. NPDC058021]|uniref:helix-turn-helix transcriptional regulator n=1 Tax=Microbacterium sp. NPDC058021 TaxID=3346306 RepID=UPI0036DAB3D1
MSAVTVELPEVATRSQVAHYTQTSVPTLARWATEGTGPKVTKLGLRAVRYRREDVLAWLQQMAEAGDR